MKQRLPRMWQIVCVIVIFSIAMTQTGVVFADGTPPPEEPTVEPPEEPTVEPPEEPKVEPTEEPTVEPTEEPTVEPTKEPTVEPTEEPTVEPAEEPTVEPTEEPTVEPTEEPTVEPTEEVIPEPVLTTAAKEEEPEEDVDILTVILNAFVDGLTGENILEGLLPESTRGQGNELLKMISDELTAAGASPDDPDFVEDLGEIVAALAEQELTLFDAEGSPLPLVSQIAVDVLSDADPMGCPEDVLPIWLGGSGDGCTASYTSIQDAIDDVQVQDGWTIYIQEGVFSEQVEVTKNVRLRGQNGTILRAPSRLTKFHGDNEYFMIGVKEHVQSIIENVEIDGLNMLPEMGRFSGVSFFGASGGIFNSTIKNFAYGAGVSTLNSLEVRVEGNDIHNNQDGVAITSSVFVEVVDNEVKDNHVGISSSISAHVDISDNIVENNSVGVKSQSSADVDITDNVIDANGMGVKINDSAEVDVEGNLITNNDIGVSNTFGLFNTINNNVIAENDVGVVNLLSLGTEITNNEIVDNGVGIVNGLTLFTNISGNRIAENEVGLLNVISLGTHVHYNEIVDNEIGVINANVIFPVYGEYNWWGCNEGPGAPGCNGFYNLLAANFRYKPWLTDFDFDGTYTMDDNCPYVYNPDQKDSDGNGVGDACEPKLTTGRGVVHFTGTLIPTTGANVVQIKCGSATTLKLPDGSIAIVDNLCGYSANLSDKSPHVIPSAMTSLDTPKYLNLDFLQPAVPSTARFSYSFAIPKSLQGEKFKVIYWDDEQGIWVTIPYRLIINGEVVSVPLYRDHPDRRVVLEGVYSSNDGTLQFMTNFPGVFVMVLDS